jgi:hypothetical protein
MRHLWSRISIEIKTSRFWISFSVYLSLEIKYLIQWLCEAKIFSYHRSMARMLSFLKASTVPEHLTVSAAIFHVFSSSYADVKRIIER